MMLIAASMILLAVSGTALGFGIACVADGNGDPDCVLLVLAPVLAGLPLAAALGIWGGGRTGLAGPMGEGRRGCGGFGRRDHGGWTAERPSTGS